MTIRTYHPGGVLDEFWDDETRTYSAYSEAGDLITSRAYTPVENAIADADARTELELATKAEYLRGLREGVPAIVAARQQAQADIATAEGLRTQAVTLSGQIAADVTALQGANLTANLAGMNTLRNAIVTVANRQKAIVDALANSYGYRKAVDENAVLTDNAILWLARLTADLILDE
jgi:hypothetical protein